MKVVLLQDVAKVGHRYDIKDVSDGYALNYLIPQALAETATKKAILKVGLVKAAVLEQKKIREDLLLKNFDDLKGVIITMERVANKEGHLFAGVHQNEIVSALKEQTRLDVEPEFLHSPAIKAVGDHEIEVKVGDRVIKFTLTIKGLPEEHKTTKKEKKK